MLTDWDRKTLQLSMDGKASRHTSTRDFCQADVDTVEAVEANRSKFKVMEDAPETFAGIPRRPCLEQPQLSSSLIFIYTH